MSTYARITVVACPVCRAKQGLSGVLHCGSVVICATCHSSLLVTTLRPIRLRLVDPASTRTAESQPESYA
ncbi:hypothetical protein [Herpetosiphon llansteffanensis]|uniref:hypothetical protein n=1 Tax=Herpetosiphon llansteffanensis TaxID=2094568 RepID=UPI000F51A173|nr:hypothetical protein [Herpetosiphon llansteffanensis]